MLSSHLDSTCLRLAVMCGRSAVQGVSAWPHRVWKQSSFLCHGV